MIPERRTTGPRYANGEMAPLTAIYRVMHSEHRLPAEVTLALGQMFPRCARCLGAVQFELLRLTQGKLPAGTMTLNELPVLDGDEADEAAAS